MAATILTLLAAVAAPASAYESFVISNMCSAPIEDGKNCAQAVKDLGLAEPYDSSPISTGYPTGCFRLSFSGYTYLNDNAMISADGYFGTSICNDETLTGDGTCMTTSGFTPGVINLANVDDCEAYASSNGLTYQGSEFVTEYPSG